MASTSTTHIFQDDVAASRIQLYVSQVFDISVANFLTNRPLLYDPDFEIIIHDVWVMYQAAGGTSGSDLTIGTVADGDAVATTYTTSTTNAAGDVASVPLASTLKRPGIQKYGGKPVLPKATLLVSNHTQAGGGTGDFVLMFRYSKVVPST